MAGGSTINSRWRPRRRLWQLESVSARGLSLPPGDPAAGAYFVLWTLLQEASADGPQWLASYRSEAVWGTANPDWMPIAGEEACAAGGGGTAAASGSSVLVTLHAVPCGREAGEPPLSRPTVFPADSAPQMCWPAAEATASRELHGARNGKLGGVNGATSEPDEAESAPPEAEPAAAPTERSLPGTLLAAWAVDLKPAPWLGEEAAALRTALKPNSILLDFADGCCVHPPPEEEEWAPSASSSLRSSPEKKPGLATAAAAAGAAAAAEQLGGGTAPSTPSRRFASLLISRITRSAPGLQGDGAEAAGSSDVGSDRGSEYNGASREELAWPEELTGSAGPAGAHVLHLADAQQSLRALAGLRERLLSLQARSQGLQQQLGAALAAQAERGQAAKEAAATRMGAAAAAQRAEHAAAAAERVREQAARARRLTLLRSQALVTALKALQAGERRLREAEASLGGEEGRGRLAAVHAELVARRCLMVWQLGSIFRVGPITVSVAEAPPGGYLEERLERLWAGGEGGGGSSSGAPASQQPAPRAVAPAGGALLGRQVSLRGPQYRQESRLAIGGLELDAAAWRRAVVGLGPGADDGAEIDPQDDQATAVALGYVAHLVDRLAAYLDVPLRYPLRPRGSRSTVWDNWLPAGTWAAGEAAPPRGALFGGGRRDASAAAAPALAPARPPVEYPLFCAEERERPRFAVGVYLLNKDAIQLLQAHGLTAGGPSFLLQNVHSLLLAAGSSVPAGLR